MNNQKRYIHLSLFLLWLMASVLLAGGAHAQGFKCQTAAAYTARGIPDQFLGINMLFEPASEAALRARFEKVRKLGVSEVRIDWPWRAVEYKRGAYDWRKMDALVRLAHSYQIDLLPMVHYAPDWAVVSGKKRARIYEMAPRPEVFKDYAAFVKASIKRYGPSGSVQFAFRPIKHWEIWNEPNIKEFWGFQPDAKHYAALLKETAEALAPYRHSIKIVHGGLAGNDIVFLKTLYDLDKNYGDYFDVLSLHVYPLDMKTKTLRKPWDIDRDRPDIAALGFIGSAEDSAYLPKIYNMQLFMNLRGDKDKPIWLTETGVLTAKKTGGIYVSEQEHAAYMQGIIGFTHKVLGQKTACFPKQINPGVEKLFWFALEDYAEPSNLGSFGLYDIKGRAKPAASSMVNKTN